jgi:hypothetical protein
MRKAYKVIVRKNEWQIPCRNPSHRYEEDIALVPREGGTDLEFVLIHVLVRNLIYLLGLFVR